MKPAVFVACWLLANFIAVGVYDLVAYFCLEPDQSVSYWLQRWMQDWPMLAVLLGVILGHLAWPLHRVNGKGL